MLRNIVYSLSVPVSWVAWLELPWPNSISRHTAIRRPMGARSQSMRCQKPQLSTCNADLYPMEFSLLLEIAKDLPAFLFEPLISLLERFNVIVHSILSLCSALHAVQHGFFGTFETQDTLDCAALKLVSCTLRDILESRPYSIFEQ